MKKYFVSIIMILFTFGFCYAQSNLQESFKSTSIMIMSGSLYSSSPTINEYGEAVYENNTQDKICGPRKAGARNPGTPGIGELQLPIGDTPTIFFTCLLLIYILMKIKPRRKIFGV